MAKHGSLNAIARSDFYAVVDEEICTGCEICIDRCQFNALEIVDGVCKVDTTFCFGCGLCVTTCASGAITLQQKNSEELTPPPLNDEEWRIKREASRKK